ncbi:pra1 family protein f2, partial [Phtheirospermum japonicum]
NLGHFDTSPYKLFFWCNLPPELYESFTLPPEFVFRRIFWRKVTHTRIVKDKSIFSTLKVTTYGIFPTSSSPSGTPDNLEYISHAKERIKDGLGTRRPWREMFQLHCLNLPKSVQEAVVRVRTNFAYFQMNYAIFILGVLFLNILWHPILLMVFIAMMAVWLFLYFLRDEPLVVFSRLITDRVVLIVLAVVTVVVLLLTHATTNILSSLLIGVVVVLIHAAMRKTDDLFADEEAAGGLLRSSGGRLNLEFIPYLSSLFLFYFYFFNFPIIKTLLPFTIRVCVTFRQKIRRKTNSGGKVKLSYSSGGK